MNTKLGSLLSVVLTLATTSVLAQPQSTGLVAPKHAMTIRLDPATHRTYGFVPEYGPDPAPDPNAPPPPPPVPGRPPAPRGPVIAGWFISITH